MDFETQIHEMIVSVVSETEAANIDLEHVTAERNASGRVVAYGLGDESRDGTVTVDSNDVVAVFAQGLEHDSNVMPGAFEHFADVYDTQHWGDLVAWATTRRSMFDVDPGIAVTRRHGGTWLAFSDVSVLGPDWGMVLDDPARLDTEAADTELENLGYRRTGSQWIDSGGQWATDVEKVESNRNVDVSLNIVTNTERIDNDGTRAYIVPQGGGNPEVVGVAAELGPIPANEDLDGWEYGADAVLSEHGYERTGEWIGSGLVTAPVRLTDGR